MLIPRAYRALSSFARWLLPVAGYLALALVASWSLLAVRGIPLTDDGLGLQIMETYRRAYRAGDFFPLWSSFLEKGRGAPLPLFYHRLHAQAFAFLALWVGTTRAVKVSIPVLLVVGAEGTRHLCKALGVRGATAWVGGALVLSSSYALLDWYDRGAIAEFTAFMLLPWCIHCLLRMLDKRSSPLPAAITTALLFFAHMMTFYFFVLVIVVATMFALRRAQRLGWGATRALGTRVFGYGLLVSCFIGPYVLALLYVLPAGNLPPMVMAARYPTPLEYVFSPHYSWTRAIDPGVLSVEIGRWMLLCLGLLLLIERGAGKAIWARAPSLVVVVLLFLLLQLKEMSFFFDIVPSASTLQFPLRLLVYIVTIAAVCTALAAEAAQRSELATVRLCGTAFPLIAVGGQLAIAVSCQRMIYSEALSREGVDTIVGASDPTADSLARFPAWESFDLQVAPPTARRPFLETSPGCTFSSSQINHEKPMRSYEGPRQVGALRITVHGSGCTVHVYQLLSPLLAVDLSKPGEISMDPDGSMSIKAPLDGTVVRIRERGVLELAAASLHQTLEPAR